MGMKSAPLTDLPEIDKLRLLLAEQEAKISAQSNEIAWLKEQLGLSNINRFGSSSEKHPAQDDLFNEAETCESIEVTEEDSTTETIDGYERKKSGRRPLPKDLPRERIVHDLTDEEKSCDCCGGELHLVGEEISEQLDIVPAKVKVLQHVKLKYGCRGCEDGITTAMTPKQPIPGSIASPNTLAYVVTAKYCDALPLYRQSVIFGRIGVDISRSTLSHWMMRSAEVLQPLYQAMYRQLLSEPILHADETTTQVLDEPDKAAQTKSYMWLYCTGTDTPVANNPFKNIVLYEYQPGRSGCYPANFLLNYTGYLQVDGYQGYDQTKAKLAGCWAHARRKFDEAEKAQPKGKTGKANWALNHIQKLYRIETRIKDKTALEKQAIRKKESEPLLNQYKAWLEKSLLNTLPKSKLGEALNYSLNQWDKLVQYVEDGHLSIDNNRAERAIKPFVIGRKNWLFSQTANGANASAMLYSIVETAKANGLIPYDYISYYLTQICKPGCQIDDLLPWNIKS